jgi:hypothetical protein
MSDPQQPARQAILAFLATVRLRLSLRTGADQALFALCLLLFSFIVWRLLRDVLGEVSSLALLVVATLIVITMSVRAMRATTLAQAAGATDHSAQLDDELMSAHSFMQAEVDEAWTSAQIERAATTVKRLDPRSIVPLRMPRSWVPALVLAVLAIIAPWISRDHGMTFELPQAEAKNRDGHARLGDGSHDDTSTAKSSSVQNQSASNAAALEENRGLIEHASVEALAARDALRELASALGGKPEALAAAQSMQDGHPDEALALARKLAQEMERLAEKKTDAGSSDSVLGTNHRSSRVPHPDR